MLRRDRLLCGAQFEREQTSCCCAPSCRSRSIRRRVASAVATIRARDASSSARLSVFAIAVATSSVNSASRLSVSGGGGSSVVETTAGPPERPSTKTGAPTDERQPKCRAAAGAGRAHRRNCRSAPGRRVSKISPDTVPSRGNRSRVDVAAAPGPAPESGYRAFGLVAGESGGVGRNQPSDLGAHRLEHGRRPRALRHECGDPPQRRLLLRKPGVPRVPDVCDRGRHELGELCETMLRSSGSGDPGDDVEITPHTHPSTMMGAPAPCEPATSGLGGEGVRHTRVILDPRRPPRAENLRGHRRAVERPARTGVDAGRSVAPRGEDSHRPPPSS